jgi:hypothetical protein
MSKQQKKYSLKELQDLVSDMPPEEVVALAELTVPIIVDVLIRQANNGNKRAQEFLQKDWFWMKAFIPIL